MVNFVLLQKGTNNRIMNAFVNEFTYTDVNGYFNTWLYFQDTIPYDEYDLRADFNGTWGISIEPYIITYNHINDSSDTIDFNITKEITFNVLFSIDGRPSEYPNPFIDTASLVNAKRGQPLNLSVVVFDPETSSVVPNQIVNFYDYTNGDVPIGSNITDSNGIAWLNFTPDTTIKAGPNLLYARSGGGSNYSYYILNESIYVNLISGPSPTTINIQSGIGSTQFNIQGNITDEVNNPISYAEINLRLLRGGLDYSGFLIPSQSYITLLDDIFILWFRVQDITPIGNYSLRMDFNGTFAFEDPYDNNNPYKYRFNLISLSNASPFQNELRVFDPDRIEIDLSVEGYPTTDLYDDSYRPQRYKSGEVAHFQVNVTQSGGYPTPGSWVYIYDVYESMNPLNSYQFGPSNGFVQFNISINIFSFAGIHEIRVQYETFTTINTTFIIINETVSINTDDPIINNVVQRNDGGFYVTGNVADNLRGLEVRLLLFDENYNNVSQYLIGGNIYDLTDSDGNFRFDINSIGIEARTIPYSS